MNEENEKNKMKIIEKRKKCGHLCMLSRTLIWFCIHIFLFTHFHQVLVILKLNLLNRNHVTMNEIEHLNKEKKKTMRYTEKKTAKKDTRTHILRVCVCVLQLNIRNQTRRSYSVCIHIEWSFLFRNLLTEN